MTLPAPEFLFVDCETSGLYRHDLDHTDPAQPWIQAIAAALCNEQGIITNHFSFVIKTDGRTVKDKAEAVHGISARTSSQYGIPESRMLGALKDMLATAPSTLKIITFGSFDRDVLSSLYAKLSLQMGKPSGFLDYVWKERRPMGFIDLQKPTLQYACMLPPAWEGGDPKWPTLDEACEILLALPKRTGNHGAWDDMLRLKHLYFECARRGYLRPEQKPREKEC